MSSSRIMFQLAPAVTCVLFVVFKEKYLMAERLQNLVDLYLPDF
jgi:hypothetical protein